MEFALEYKEKQSWNGKFPSHYKLAESIRKRKFPPNITPSKNKPLKKGALKNISPGAYFWNFTVFYNKIIERLNITFTSNGKREFKPCDQVSQLINIVVYCSLFLHKLRVSQNGLWADKNSSKQFLWIKKSTKLLIYVESDVCCFLYIREA